MLWSFYSITLLLFPSLSLSHLFLPSTSPGIHTTFLVLYSIFPKTNVLLETPCIFSISSSSPGPRLDTITASHFNPQKLPPHPVSKIASIFPCSHSSLALFPHQTSLILVCHFPYSSPSHTGPLTIPHSDSHILQSLSLCPFIQHFQHLTLPLLLLHH